MMGDRYFIICICPKCGFTEDDFWYAPTCDVLEWECPECGNVLGLQGYTGISIEDASNRGAIEQIIKAVSDERG